MSKESVVKVIIPAYNEEKSVGRVLDDIPAEWADEVIVVDNNSTDSTGSVARSRGATVLKEEIRGYGAACQKGISHIASSELKADVVVFMDADYSDYPGQMRELIEPIQNNTADLVIGSRALGAREKGSMTFPQVFGNWLATGLLRLFYGVRFTDLGPFRAIRYTSLQELQMQDMNYGWTVEMQLKAAKLKLRTAEVAVDYRRRIGKSKVSGTVKGTFMTGYKILWTIFKYL